MWLLAHVLQDRNMSNELCILCTLPDRELRQGVTIALDAAIGIVTANWARYLRVPPLEEAGHEVREAVRGRLAQEHLGRVQHVHGLAFAGMPFRNRSDKRKTPPCGGEILSNIVELNRIELSAS